MLWFHDAVQKGRQKELESQALKKNPLSKSISVASKQPGSAILIFSGIC
jgi:hypothetical protein